MADVTPTGRPKYKVELSYNAGTAVDRIQEISDLRIPEIDESTKLLPNSVFQKGHQYMTYSWLPKSEKEVFLLTSKCEQSGLDHEQSIEWVKKGMEECVNRYNELTSDCGSL